MKSAEDYLREKLALPTEYFLDQNTPIESIVEIMRDWVFDEVLPEVAEKAQVDSDGVMSFTDIELL